METVKNREIAAITRDRRDRHIATGRATLYDSKQFSLPLRAFSKSSILFKAFSRGLPEASR